MAYWLRAHSGSRNNCWLFLNDKFLSHRIKKKKLVITQCACINDGVTLKEKFTAPEMDDIARKKKKLSGIDSINRGDPNEYMRCRLEENFNSIQLIASSRLSIALSQFRGPDYLGAGTGYLGDCNRPNHPHRPAALGFKEYMTFAFWF